VTPANRAELVSDLATKARRSVTFAGTLLAAAERVSAAVEAAEAAQAPDLAGLTRALDDLDGARRSLDAGLHEAGHAADCLLDAFGARTRHVRR
jgi:hypothetical protein